MYIVGVDPGLAGAVAVLDAHGILEALTVTLAFLVKLTESACAQHRAPYLRFSSGLSGPPRGTGATRKV